MARAVAARLAGAVNLERFSPAGDGASVRACHEIYLSGLPADDPRGPAQSFRFFAGWMELGWTEDPSEAWVKIAMLELLAEREPQLTRIITGNADANEHMGVINADLGFSVLDEWPCFEIGATAII